MHEGKIRIGTRGSPLALKQAHEVRDRLEAAHGAGRYAFDIVPMKTTGDRIQDRPLSDAGGKGLFTKEIEEALLAGSVDIAVHSMKDMATEVPHGLAIACVLPREDVRDAFISRKGQSLRDLPAGSVVATASLRRQAQVKHLRADVTVVSMRGNVETRLRKLDAGEADATLLAMAGLIRLGLADRAAAPIPVEEILPAVAQGAIAIEARAEDEGTAALLGPINDEATALAVTAERAFLAKLEGSCRMPIAALAELVSGNVHFRGMILSPDGVQRYATSRNGPAAEALMLAEDAAAELIDEAGPGFFRAL